MPTITLEPGKEQSVASFPGTGNVGSGGDAHAPVGTNSQGKDFRELVRFDIKWGGINRLLSATLRLRTSGGSHVTPNGNGSIRIKRIGGASGGFQAGGGGENYWATNARTVWPGPNTVQTLSRSNPGTAPDVWRDFDVTAIVAEWAPSTVLVPSGTGSGRTNQGVAIDSGDGRYEFRTLRSGQPPRLVLEYDTEPDDPTIIVSSPDEEFGLVTVLGDDEPEAEMTPRFSFDYTAPPGQSIGSVTWQLLDSGGLELTSGVVAHDPDGGSADVDVPWACDPGAEYRAVVTVTADSGPVSASVPFVFPVAEAIQAVELARAPLRVGVTDELVPLVRDDRVSMHYARSRDGTVEAIDGGWQGDVPPDWPPLEDAGPPALEYVDLFDRIVPAGWGGWWAQDGTVATVQVEGGRGLVTQDAAQEGNPVWMRPETAEAPDITHLGALVRMGHDTLPAPGEPAQELGLWASSAADAGTHIRMGFTAAGDDALWLENFERYTGWSYDGAIGGAVGTRIAAGLVAPFEWWTRFEYEPATGTARVRAWLVGEPEPSVWLWEGIDPAWPAAPLGIIRLGPRFQRRPGITGGPSTSWLERITLVDLDTAPAPPESWWLLARERIVRQAGGYVPPEPEGVRSLSVRWRVEE